MEAEELLYKERKGNNEDINILSTKYNFKIKIYITKAESYVKEEKYGEKGPYIYMLLEKSKDDSEINHVSDLIPIEKDMYGNYKEFETIRDKIYEEIKGLFNTNNEKICPIDAMKIEEQKIKKSKTLKNLISKKKIKDEKEKEDESEKKHMRKVINTEVTKKII